MAVRVALILGRDLRGVVGSHLRKVLFSMKIPNEPDRIEDSSTHKDDRYYTGPGH